MVLKSYRLKLKKKKRKRSVTGNIIVGGITALVGVGLLVATSEAVSRI